MILTDDQTFRAIGYNNKAVLTPNLDRLAGEGIVFENAYIATPICVASRASLLTGVFPQQHGSVGLDPDGFKQAVVRDRRLHTPAQILAERGYLTGFAGKSHLGPPGEYGFSLGEELRDLTDEASFAFAASFLKERAQDGKPFLFWLAARQPHVPLQAEEEWLNLYRAEDLVPDPNFRECPPPGSLYNQGLPGETFYRDSDHDGNTDRVHSGPPRSREEIQKFMRAYYAVISHLDHQIGQLVEVLEQGGLMENTVILFLSDNGYHLGNHGLGNKITMHEESVRVPMFVRWEGLPVKGVRCRELVSSLDVFPTLLDLGGADSPAGLEGKSLVPLFDRPESPLREYVASECVGVGGEKGMGHRMVRSKGWKYILTDTNEEALFDETVDPYELNNLAAQEQSRETLEQMRGWMREWMNRIGDLHSPPPET